MCYGGIGHRRVSGELEGAYNSRHAYQQLDRRACQPGTLCFESSAVGMPVSSDINHLTKKNVHLASIKKRISARSFLGTFVPVHLLVIFLADQDSSIGDIVTD